MQCALSFGRNFLSATGPCLSYPGIDDSLFDGPSSDSTVNRPSWFVLHSTEGGSCPSFFCLRVSSPKFNQYRRQSVLRLASKNSDKVFLASSFMGQAVRTLEYGEIPSGHPSILVCDKPPCRCPCGTEVLACRDKSPANPKPTTARRPSYESTFFFVLPPTGTGLLRIISFWQVLSRRRDWSLHGRRKLKACCQGTLGTFVRHDSASDGIVIPSFGGGGEALIPCSRRHTPTGHRQNWPSHRAGPESFRAAGSSVFQTLVICQID
ncbi:hypothetical protein LZ32DRAFT_258598 [Colletotrichum eremochloae]|nr:hypothetical protein LZ32DRAFT_258598 [Colletotrichum eremochloae]